jgi:hypothetical protein
VGVHVIRVVLGVVFDHENGHLIPEFAASGGFDDTAHTQVVAADKNVRAPLAHSLISARPDG